VTRDVRPTVDIVIVNWNTGGYLTECLRSIAGTEQHGLRISRVTVVDNASSDGSADGLEEVPLPLELVRNRANVGFAAACNQGAADSVADYLLFLNPDTRLLPDTLATVTRFMESERARDVGICGVRLLDDAGDPAVACARFPTLRVMLGKMTGLDRVMPRVFPSHHLSPVELRESRPVDQVIGAFYFVRRDLFAQLGGFDERYFIYFEEVDFALRALRHGARSYFLGEATAFHAENVSSDQIGGARLYHSLRSRLLFARKHFPPWQARAILVLTLTVELIARLVVGLARRRPSELSVTTSAYRRLVRELLGAPMPASDAGRL
jgi:N-acetylglucosaminyl-diphospho-decaprenol L-rhamnosyltransferase